MKLGRTFLGIYAFFMIFMVLTSLMMDEAWRKYIEKDINTYTGYKFMLAAIADYVRNHPEDEWKEVIANVNDRYKLPLAIDSKDKLDSLPLSNKEYIKEGHVGVYYDEETVVLVYGIEDTDMALKLGPAHMPTRPRVESMIRIMWLAFLAIIILVWLWPVSKDLERLRKAACAFGDGDFSVRAVQPHSAMLGSTINAFNMMADRITSLVNAHKELTNAVSHELRTPLARSKFALQMIDTYDDKEKQGKYLKQIQGDIHELEELISEMLIYASFDSDKPKLDIDIYSVKQAVESQVAAHKDFLDDISISIPDDVYADFDRHFIERAISNFLTNAKKYGGDKVLVEVLDDNDDVSIIVHDNGVGVDDQFKQVAFNAFSRADPSRCKDTKGFGSRFSYCSTSYGMA